MLRQLRSFLCSQAQPTAFSFFFRLHVEFCTREYRARLMQIRTECACFPLLPRSFHFRCAFLSLGQTPSRDTANYTLVNRSANLSPAIRPSEFQRPLSRHVPTRPFRPATSTRRTAPRGLATRRLPESASFNAFFQFAAGAAAK